MGLKDELKVMLDKLFQIYMLAKEAYLYTEYFHNPITNEERNLVSNSHQSNNIQFIMHLMFRSLITEVTKLYNIKERVNIPKLINMISSKGHFRKAFIPNFYIKKWEILLADYKEQIIAIKILRDEVYAHSDNPLKDYNETDITFENIRNLLDLTEEILAEVFSITQKTHLVANSPSFKRENFEMLKLLAKAENQRIDDIHNQFLKWQK